MKLMSGYIALHGKAGDQPLITARLNDRDVAFVPSDLADENGKARLGHAYASTIYGAQELTADNSFVLLDPASNRHDTYVALSRARSRTEIFADRKLIDAGIRAELPLSARSAAPEHHDETRTAWLGVKISRSAVKGTTLDLIAAPPESVQRRPQERTRGTQRMPEIEPA